MQFWYVPANYHGRGYGAGVRGYGVRGYGMRGYGLRGYGMIVGGNIGAFTEPSVQVPVSEESATANITKELGFSPEEIEKMRKIVAMADAKGKAVPITKKQAGLWTGIKNIASKGWEMAKKAAENPYVRTLAPLAVGLAAPYLPGLAKSGVSAAMKGAKVLKGAMDSGIHQGKVKLYKRLLDDVGKEVAMSEDTTAGENVAVALENAGAAVKKVAPEIAEKTVEVLGDVASTVGDAGVQGAKVAAKYGAKGVKALANAGVQGTKLLGTAAWELGKYGAKKGIQGLKNVFGFLGRKKKSGNGYYGGRLRLKKGSAEAKLYMATLRSLRKNKGKKRTKKGSGIRGYGMQGGMIKGWTLAQLQALLNDPENDNKDYFLMPWRDKQGNAIYKDGEPRTTNVSRANLRNMITGTRKIREYYKRVLRPDGSWGADRTPAEAKNFRKTVTKRYRRGGPNLVKILKTATRNALYVDSHGTADENDKADELLSEIRKGVRYYNRNPSEDNLTGIKVCNMQLGKIAAKVRRRN